MLYITIIIVIIFNFISVKAQFQDISISVGLNTTQIIGNNANVMPISPLDSTSVFGGGMGGIQPGFMCKLNIGLDSAGKFCIPVGFEYTVYTTAARIPGTVVNYFFSNKITAPAFTLGLNYSFFKMPASDVWFYGSLEGRGSFFQSGDYSKIIKDHIGNTLSTEEHKSKVPAVRIGTDLHAGVIGNIINNFYVNTGIGAGVLNIIGKDNSRGDLFTIDILRPDSGRETTVWNLYLFFMIQFRL